MDRLGLFGPISQSRRNRSSILTSGPKPRFLTKQVLDQRLHSLIDHFGALRNPGTNHAKDIKRIRTAVKPLREGRISLEISGLFNYLLDTAHVSGGRRFNSVE
jgi:hypothetical protein